MIVGKVRKHNPKTDGPFLGGKGVIILQGLTNSGRKQTQSSKDSLTVPSKSTEKK